MHDFAGHLTAASGAILCVDFGLKRLGLAVSDPGRRTAVGAGSMRFASSRAAARAVMRAAGERSAPTILVGSPPAGGDRNAEVVAGADRLAAALEKLGFEILRWAEDYTTSEALAARRHYGGKSSAGNGWTDEAAAVLILQGYLDALRSKSASV